MKNLSTVKKIIIAVVSVVLVLAIAGGAYCISTKQSPAQATKSIFTSSDNQIVGKWQSQKNPGLSAYIFYEDGTYDSYISTANFSGNYEVDGNELILKNPSTAKEITYKFSVNEKELTLTIIDEALATDEKEVSKYDRVDELNQKSFADIIGELKEDKETTTGKE